MDVSLGALVNFASDVAVITFLVIYGRKLDFLVGIMANTQAFIMTPISEEEREDD